MKPKYLLILLPFVAAAGPCQPQDEDTIVVTIASGKNAIDLEITKAGEVTEKK
jgi:hypothetical protein